MTATERRIQLAIVLRNRKRDTIDNLAFEFVVCRNTIKNDLMFLTEYMCLTTQYMCLTTQQGRGGGVKVDSRSRDPTTFTEEEWEVLQKLLPQTRGRDHEVLQGIIRKIKRREE